MQRINGYSAQVNSLDRLTELKRPAAPKAGANPAAGQAKSANFGEELKAATAQRVTFSKHALQRIHSRNLNVTEADVTKLSEAVDKANAKGSRQTLALTESAAFVIAVKDRTVISAFDRANLREGVFTSIDSAVIL